jgi:hypothetical protein
MKLLMYKRTGLIELVGKDEALDQNKFSASVEVALDPIFTGRGALLKGLTFFQWEEGDGAIQAISGNLLILDADPAVTANSADLTLAEWKTCRGYVSIATSDWVGGTAGQVVHQANVDLPIPNSSTSIWLVFEMTSATPMNDTADNDEVLAVELILG